MKLIRKSSAHYRKNTGTLAKNIAQQRTPPQKIFRLIVYQRASDYFFLDSDPEG